MKRSSSKRQGASSRTHYPRAPIVEAVIDVRAQLPDTFAIDQLEHVRWGNPDEYPTISPLIQANIAFDGKSEHQKMSAVTTHTKLGFRAFSADHKWIIQARSDGFSFSRLSPYNRWETFVHEARRFWFIYANIAKPTDITRIAVRYINKLDLPLPVTDFGEYLATVPIFAPAVGTGVSGFVIQIQIPQDTIPGGMLVLNEGIVGPSDAGNISVLLDIDLYQQVALSPDGDMLWDHLEVLHRRKNEIFEACITDKTRELIS